MAHRTNSLQAPKWKASPTQSVFQRLNTLARFLRIKLTKQVEHYLSVVMVLVLNLPLLSLILFLNLKGVQLDALVLFYVLGVIFGYYVLALLVILTALSLPLLFSGRLTLLVNGVLLTLFTYYLLLDHFVWDVFRFHIDSFWLEYLIYDFSGLGLPASSVVMVIAGLIGLACLELGFFRLARRIRRRKSILLGVTLIGLVAFASSQVVHIVAYERNISRITSLTPHFPSYMPFTSHRNAVKYGDLLSITKAGLENDTHDRQYSSMKYPLRDIRSDLPDGNRLPNIVFILLESWRFDTMNESVTPAIHSLSEKSSVFESHFSSGNSTTSGVFGLLYGLHPTYWMAVKSNNAALHNPLLIDLMVDAHYSFGIYADSKFKRHKIKDTMFRDIEVHETFSGSANDEKDEDMKNQVISFIRGQRASSHPFMLFAFFKSSHYHYTYPESFRKFTPAKEMNMALVNRGGARNSYLNDYLNAVYYNDALIGEILDELESSGMMDETVIVITTDHGEEFDDNGAGYWGHGSNYTQYQTRVPLVLYYPGKEPEVVTRPTAHVDIPTTLIQDVFGVRNEITDYSNGRNLFDDRSGDRPLVIGSYFNHAFVIEDNVYAIFPAYTRQYRLDDINAKAANPRADLVRTAMEESTRFYAKDSRHTSTRLGRNSDGCLEVDASAVRGALRMADGR
jgi:membrane-anchored protein YejM (alkaline phosphatase superfamily)